MSIFLMLEIVSNRDYNAAYSEYWRFMGIYCLTMIPSGLYTPCIVTPDISIRVISLFHSALRASNTS